MSKKFLIKLFLIVSIFISLIAVSKNVAIADWSIAYSDDEMGLFGVWGSSSADMFAVGGSNSIGGTRNVVHYDGSSWSIIHRGREGVLYDVWGRSSSDVFAVSSQIHGDSILHYDGSSWSVMNTGTVIHYFGIWGDISSVFAVGGNGAIIRYDGSSWSVIQEHTAHLSPNLRGVWGSSGSDVFVVGDSSTMFHYNGFDWSLVDFLAMINIGDSLNAVWGSSGSDVFVVSGGGYIYHYDGSTWSVMDSFAGYSLEDIWGSSGDDVFVVGSRKITTGWKPPSSIILHYDGIKWSVMESGSTKYLLHGVWGSSGTNVFAVGSNFTSEGDLIGGVILHYDGTLPTTTTSIIATTSTTSASLQPCASELIYGEHSEQTEFLRYFRDNALSQTPEGQELIKLYYQWSPAIVKAMEGDEEFKEVIKGMIDGILTLIRGEV